MPYVVRHSTLGVPSGTPSFEAQNLASVIGRIENGVGTLVDSWKLDNQFVEGEDTYLVISYVPDPKTREEFIAKLEI